MCDIRIDNLKLSYKSATIKKQKVIADITNFYIKDGDVVGFFGPNHVGKSTLLKYISQIHSDFYINLKSSITYNGEILKKKENKPIILYVPQDYNSSIFPWLSIKKNIRIILEALKYSEDEIENKVNIFCKDLGFNNEEELFNYYGFNNEEDNSEIKKVSDLSGGQKQIISLLRTLIVTPNIIAMDEPFSAIDIFNKGVRFRNDVMQYLRLKNITTIIVSHELEEIVDFTDTLYIFNYDDNGKIIKGIEDSNISKDEFPNFVKKLNTDYKLNLML